MSELRGEPSVLERRVTVGSAVGLHARPAARLVRAVAQSGVPVTIGKHDGPAVNAGSILSVLSLRAECGDQVVLQTADETASDALDQLAALVASDLDAES
jgi:phosphocarrier protein HPr